MEKDKGEVRMKLRDRLLKMKIKKKDEISSSSARTMLVQKIREVIKTENDIGINVDGKEVVTLTLTEPRPSSTPALRITTVEATQGWSELLNFISIMGARFYFKLKPLDDEEETPRVYLVRGDFRNRFQAPWKEHRRKWVEEQMSGVDNQKEINEPNWDKLDDLHEKFGELEKTIESISRQIVFSVASKNRNGDLYAVPELGIVPLRKASDFPNPHCGD